jgi:hypothetical protein
MAIFIADSPSCQPGSDLDGFSPIDLPAYEFYNLTISFRKSEERMGLET